MGSAQAELGRRQQLVKALPELFAHGGGQLLQALEVVVERPLRDAGGLHNVIHRERLKGPLSHKRRASFDDLRPCPGTLLPSDLRPARQIDFRHSILIARLDISHIDHFVALTYIVNIRLARAICRIAAPSSSDEELATAPSQGAASSCCPGKHSFGTKVRVTNEKTGKSVAVRINDRGPYAHGRVIDLSKAAAEAVGIAGVGQG